MRSRRRFAIWTTVVLALFFFLAITGLKHLSNEFQSAVEKRLHEGLPAPSAEAARSRGAFVFDLNCTPGEVMVEGTTVSVREVWLEHAVEPRPTYVWWTKYERLGHFNLCLTLEKGGELFGRGSRFYFDFPSVGRGRLPTHPDGPDPGVFWARFDEPPTLPLEMRLIDDRGQAVVGRMTLRRN
jgi:hypothetical protein